MSLMHRLKRLETAKAVANNSRMPRVPVLYYKGERTHGEKIALNETTNGVEAVRRGLKVGKAILCQEMSDEVWEQQAEKQQSELLDLVKSESKRRRNDAKSRNDTHDETKDPFERWLKTGRL